MDKIKNCLAFTNALFISNNNSFCSPCCWYGSAIHATSWNEYVTKLNSIKSNIINCRHCIEQYNSNAIWQHIDLYTDDTFVVGISLGNTCNLKCVTCNPRNSILISKDMAAIGIPMSDAYAQVVSANNNYLEDKLSIIKDSIQSNIDKFEVIKIELFGGEPLIMKETYSFLEWLRENLYSDKIELVVTTNGTVDPYRILKYANDFKTMCIQISIDGIDDVFEYLRYGANFNNVVNNINIYNKYHVAGIISLSMHYTLSWMNSMHFINFIKWKTKYFSDINCHITNVVSPEYYAIEVLPIEIREQIDSQAAEIQDIDNSVKLFRNIIMSTTTSDHNLAVYNNGRSILTKLDKLRNLNHTTTFSSIIRPLNEFI